MRGKLSNWIFLLVFIAIVRTVHGRPTGSLAVGKVQVPLEKSLSGFMESLRENWESPIGYLRLRGYIPNDPSFDDDTHGLEKHQTKDPSHQIKRENVLADSSKVANQSTAVAGDKGKDQAHATTPTPTLTQTQPQIKEQLAKASTFIGKQPSEKVERSQGPDQKQAEVHVEQTTAAAIATATSTAAAVDVKASSPASMYEAKLLSIEKAVNSGTAKIFSKSIDNKIKDILKDNSISHHNNDSANNKPGEVAIKQSLAGENKLFANVTNNNNNNRNDNDIRHKDSSVVSTARTAANAVNTHHLVTPNAANMLNAKNLLSPTTAAQSASHAPHLDSESRSTEYNNFEGDDSGVMGSCSGPPNGGRGSDGYQLPYLDTMEGMAVCDGNNIADNPMLITYKYDDNQYKPKQDQFMGGYGGGDVYCSGKTYETPLTYDFSKFENFAQPSPPKTDYFDYLKPVPISQLQIIHPPPNTLKPLYPPLAPIAAPPSDQKAVTEKTSFLSDMKKKFLELFGLNKPEDMTPAKQPPGYPYPYKSFSGENDYPGRRWNFDAIGRNWNKELDAELDKMYRNEQNKNSRRNRRGSPYHNNVMMLMLPRDGNGDVGAGDDGPLEID